MPRDMMLPTTPRVAAPLSFNIGIGIELAQLAFVALFLFPLAWLARKPNFYRTWVVRAGSVGIAVIAGFWVITRGLL